MTIGISTARRSHGFASSAGCRLSAPGSDGRFGVGGESWEKNKEGKNIMTGQKTVRRRWSSVPIYFLNQKVVYSRSGKSFSAIFSGPYALNEEPYIRIAVGNYPNLLVARRQEDKLLKEHPAPLNMEVYENSQRKHQKSGSIMPKAQNKLLKICLAGDQNFLGYIL